MTGVGPTNQRPHSTEDGSTQQHGIAHEDGAPRPEGSSASAPSPAIERVGRLTAANMLRSMLPLVVISLLVVAWTNLRQSGDASDPVREVDPSTTVQLAAARADYPLVVPTGLAEEYRPTSARTDAGDASDGDPVTLEIGYVTPSQEFAGFVVSDDRGAEPLLAALEGAEEQGTLDLAGETWTRSTTESGETALSREVDDVTVVVTGSAPDEELETVAAAVRPYSR